MKNLMPGRQTTQKIFRFLDKELLNNYDMDANYRCINCVKAKDQLLN